MSTKKISITLDTDSFLVAMGNSDSCNSSPKEKIIDALIEVAESGKLYQATGERLQRYGIAIEEVEEVAP